MSRIEGNAIDVLQAGRNGGRNDKPDGNDRGERGERTRNIVQVSPPEPGIRIPDNYVDGTGHGTPWKSVSPFDRPYAPRGLETSTLLQAPGVTISRERAPDGTDNIVVRTGKGDDVVRVDQNPDGTLSVTVNGEEFTLRLEGDQKLEIRGGRGDDAILVSPDVTSNQVIARGGRGDDYLSVYSSGAEVRGGRGDDNVYSHGAGATVVGGRGDDIVTSTGAGSQVTGSWGNNTVVSTGEGSTVNNDREGKTAPPEYLMICQDPSVTGERVRRTPR